MTTLDPGGAVQILLADDDEVDRLAVKRALRSARFAASLTEVADAAAALKELRRGTFHCAILDLRMPGHDGEWLLRTAREEAVDVPIVILTGHGDEQTAVELMKAGAIDYLVKADLSPERLAQTLRNAIRVKEAEDEARRAAARLEESEERLRIALDVAKLGAWHVDLETHVVTSDVRCRALFGFAASEVPGPDEYRRAFVPEDMALLDAAVARAREDELRGQYELEVRIRRAGDGEARWLKVAGRALFERGRAVRLIGTAQDCTERRRAEEERAQQAAFEQELIGIVSHDLRNPITAMMLSASTLLRRKDLEPAVEKAITRIVKSGERASRMIRDLLDFTLARTGAGIPIQPVSVDLHDLARSTVEEVESSFPGRELRLLTEGEGCGTWDPDRLSQIFANLVRNALAYSPEGSPVTVRSAGLAREALFEVHNLGEPIPAEVLPSLFLPFQRGGKQGGKTGVGLGLYIVKQLAAAHGGDVEVVSRRGDGTRFSVRLPRRQALALEA